MRDVPRGAMSLPGHVSHLAPRTSQPFYSATGS